MSEPDDALPVPELRMGTAPAGGAPLVLDHAAGAGLGVADPRQHRRRMYFRALWSGAAARLLNIAIQAVSISLTVRYLGKERFGVWTTVSTAIAWLAVTNFGVGHGLVTRIAMLQASSRLEEARRAALSAWALVAAVSVILLPVLAGIAAYVPWASLLNVTDPRAARECTPTFVVAVTLSLVAVALNTVGPVLVGHQRNDVVNAAAAVSSVAGLALLFAATRLEWGMPALTAVMIVPNLVAAVVQAGIAWRLGLVRLGRRYLSAADAVDVLRLGSKFLLVQLFGIFIFEAGAFIIAAKFGAAEVTPYGVTSRVVMMIVTAYTVLMSPLWPAYGDAFARGDLAWARRVFGKTVRVVLGMWVIAAVVLALLGKWVIRVWAGPEAVPSTGLLWAMLIYALSYGGGLVVSQPLNGSAQVGKQVLAAAVTAALNVPLALLLSDWIGVSGVALSQGLLMLTVAIPIQLVGVVRVLGGGESPGAPPQHGVNALPPGQVS